MKHFKVYVTEKYETSVDVIANTEDEAIDYINNLYNEGCIDINSPDFYLWTDIETDSDCPESDKKFHECKFFYDVRNK